MVPEPDAAAAARVDELELYRRMLLIRRFEEHIDELYRAAKMPGLGHLYIGEGAVAVGVCAALRDQDWITSTHRGHGHCMARGASVDLMFAELPGKRPRTTTARGLDAHRRPGAEQPGGNAIAGGSAVIATGAALTGARRGTDQVAVCLFGEGAFGQGPLSEGMNMASLWRRSPSRRAPSTTSTRPSSAWARWTCRSRSRPCSQTRRCPRRRWWRSGRGT